MGKMNSAFIFVLSFCLFVFLGGGGGGVGGSMGRGNQLHSLRKVSSHHVQMKWTSYGIIFTKVDQIKKIYFVGNSETCLFY